jgi:hypothetical protein
MVQGTAGPPQERERESLDLQAGYGVKGGTLLATAIGASFREVGDLSVRGQAVGFSMTAQG